VNEAVLSELAESDLVGIWAFVAQDDRVAGDRLSEEVLGKFQMLAATPKAGRKRPELGCLNPQLSGWELYNFLSRRQERN
jgi:toxin ParE1/3/4